MKPPTAGEAAPPGITLPLFVPSCGPESVPYAALLFARVGRRAVGDEPPTRGADNAK